MTKFSLSKTHFQINEVSIQFPIEIAILEKVLGNYRVKKNKYNHVYTWDDHGIIAFSKEGIVAENVLLDLNYGTYDYCSKQPFSGEFIFEDQNLFEFYEANKKQLVKLFKGDDSGAFILNGVSVWFNKEDDKITSIDIAAYEEKIKKPRLPLDKEFTQFESLWQEWITEINKIIEANNRYYNLTDGISAEDLKEHSVLEDEITIPPALLNFYKFQNVEYDAVTSAFQFLIGNWTYDLIPFEDIKEEWNSIQDLQFDEDDLPELEIDFKKIQTTNYANPKWIPFATGRNGDYLLYDTDPAENGKLGQIIELQNESWERNIVAESLEELLKNEINNLKTGKTEHFDFITGKENQD
ncbi:SMI1/KNR4 family protein [Flavobacterium aquidurense]|uniref:Cell wall assembly/cell proliferation coordinating protein, KNR4-like protein n=1 Tax=Flavobacterium aquidurense TaxID=362413 RepID=A0A0Q0S7S0_9FLAO|nr:SMI1/KNR4 family protein [Flavobacterium aquidurense]KQB39669.1 Cell wall assembly/cell proliferation coordinating protein, KNR4-like protein [Flavobacterium aquidurense]